MVSEATMSDVRERLLRAMREGWKARQQWWTEWDEEGRPPSDDEFLADAILAAFPLLAETPTVEYGVARGGFPDADEFERNRNGRMPLATAKRIAGASFGDRVVARESITWRGPWRLVDEADTKEES